MYLWNNIKVTNKHVVAVSEVEERMSQKKYLKKLLLKILPNWLKM